MTTQDFIPFALPDIGQNEIDEVVATLESGWLTTGPRVQRFESDFAGYVGTSGEAVAVTSATAGLHLALEAAGIGAGDKVAVPTYTFTATAEVVRYLAAEPILIDSDAETLNIDVDGLRAAVERDERIRAVIPVHFAGLSCPMTEIREIADRFGLSVIEDAAHAVSTESAGRLVGADSEFAAFSFYATKGITTGEGGMVIARDPDKAARIRTMALHGIDRPVYDRYQAKVPSWYYEVVAAGFKYNMSDITAAIGIHQLRRADEFLRRRTAIADRYLEAFADLPIVLPSSGRADDVHAWHLFTIRLEDAAGDRNEFIDRMSELGVGTSVHFIPLHMHPYWADLSRASPDDFPVATRAYERTVSLPIYPKMTDDAVGCVIDAVRSILASPAA